MPSSIRVGVVDGVSHGVVDTLQRTSSHTDVARGATTGNTNTSSCTSNNTTIHTHANTSSRERSASSATNNTLSSSSSSSSRLCHSPSMVSGFLLFWSVWVVVWLVLYLTGNGIQANTNMETTSTFIQESSPSSSLSHAEQSFQHTPTSHLSLSVASGTPEPKVDPTDVRSLSHTHPTHRRVEAHQPHPAALRMYRSIRSKVAALKEKHDAAANAAAASDATNDTTPTGVSSSPSPLSSPEPFSPPLVDHDAVATRPATAATPIRVSRKVKRSIPIARHRRRLMETRHEKTIIPRV